MTGNTLGFDSPPEQLSQRADLFRSILPTHSPHVLVVFDRQIEDSHLLYKALQPGSIGYTIEPNQDAIDKITTLLAQTNVLAEGF